MYRYAKCDQCGENYQLKRKSILGVSYCGNACKQKAYRARKKAEKLASATKFISVELKMYDEIVALKPKFVQEFIEFKSAHGFEVAVEMMLVVYAMMGCE